MKYLALLILLLPTAAWADQPPISQDEALARDKLLIGQLYQALGQAELKIQALQKDQKHEDEPGRLSSPSPAGGPKK